MKSIAALVEGGAHFPAAVAEQLENLFLPGIGDQRRPGLDNPRFFPGDGQEPVAQVVLVIPGNVGDHRTSGWTMLVASRRPPMPVSRIMGAAPDWRK